MWRHHNENRLSLNLGHFITLYSLCFLWEKKVHVKQECRQCGPDWQLRKGLTSSDLGPECVWESEFNSYFNCYFNKTHTRGWEHKIAGRTGRICKARGKDCTKLAAPVMQARADNCHITYFRKFHTSILISIILYFNAKRIWGNYQTYGMVLSISEAFHLFNLHISKLLQWRCTSSFKKFISVDYTEYMSSLFLNLYISGIRHAKDPHTSLLRQHCKRLLCIRN